MSLQTSVLQVLSDGHFHSGESLAQHTGVTRTAVWKICKNLEQRFSLQIDAVKGRGYRLTQPLELLDAAQIRKAMQTSFDRHQIETHLSIDSTNRRALQLANQNAASGTIVLAEHQTAGRGRQGRQWYSPFGANLYCSVLWRFSQAHADIPGLGLVIGVAIARALHDWQVSGIQLKWPNDVLCQGRKLAGILIEMQGEMSGPYAVVIGIGINVNMPQGAAQQIDQSWIDLHQAGMTNLSRNQLAAHILDNVFTALTQFTASGLTSFLAEWRDLDRFRDQPVTLHLPDKQLHGIARGIDERGALLLEQQSQLQRYYSGDVRLREAS